MREMRLSECVTEMIVNIQYIVPTPATNPEDICCGDMWLHSSYAP